MLSRRVLARARVGDDMSGITPHALGVQMLGALKPALGPLLDWASRRRLGRAVNISDLRDAASSARAQDGL